MLSPSLAGPLVREARCCRTSSPPTLRRLFLNPPHLPLSLHLLASSPSSACDMPHLSPMLRMAPNLETARLKRVVLWLAALSCAVMWLLHVMFLRSRAATSLRPAKAANVDFEARFNQALSRQRMQSIFGPVHYSVCNFVPAAVQRAKVRVLSSSYKMIHGHAPPLIFPCPAPHPGQRQSSYPLFFSVRNHYDMLHDILRVVQVANKQRLVPYFWPIVVVDATGCRRKFPINAGRFAQDTYILKDFNCTDWLVAMTQFAADFGVNLERPRIPWNYADYWNMMKEMTLEMGASLVPASVTSDVRAFVPRQGHCILVPNRHYYQEPADSCRHCAASGAHGGTGFQHRVHAIRRVLRRAHACHA
jgi:hypothetical protein